MDRLHVHLPALSRRQSQTSASEPQRQAVVNPLAGPVAVFLLATVALLPPICTVLRYDFLPLRDGDEVYVQTFPMLRASDWGLFSMVASGLELGYGAPFWFATGIPTVLFRTLEWDSAAILACRLVSLISFAGALGIVWWSGRYAGMSRLPRTAFIGLFLFMPSMVANATRMHPETFLFFGIAMSLALVFLDSGRLGGWWYASAAAYGFAVAIKVSSYPMGAGLFAYWIMQTFCRAGWKRGLTAGIGAAILAPAVFLAFNFPLLVGDNWAKFRLELQRALISNANNHAGSAIGLGWRTWIDTSSHFFLWKYWLAALVVAALVASWHEWRTRSTRPYAIVGLAAWGAAFLTTALLIKKDAWWNHYLIPAFAAFPWVVLGIYVAGKERFRSKSWPLVATVALLICTLPQIWRSSQIWFQHVAWEHTPRFQEVDWDYDVLKAYFATLPDGPPLRILRGYEQVPPSRLEGRGVEILVIYTRDFEKEMSARPDYLLLKRDPRWSVWQYPPGNTDAELGYARLPDYATIQKSRKLFADAQLAPQKIGDQQIRLEKMPLALKDSILLQVHYQ